MPFDTPLSTAVKLIGSLPVNSFLFDVLLFNIVSLNSFNVVSMSLSLKYFVNVWYPQNPKSANITITVYSPVTDILISNDNIVMQKEKTLKISAIILPEDASNKNINYKSENESIAKVDNEGNLTGISEGNTNIIVSAEEGKITKSIKVTVTRKLEDWEIIFDESLNINGNEITGLENKNNTADKIVNKLNAVFEKKGMENYKINDDTNLNQYLKMKDIAKNAVCRERVSTKDVIDSLKIEEQNKNMEDKHIW